MEIPMLKINRLYMRILVIRMEKLLSTFAFGRLVYPTSQINRVHKNTV